MADKYINLKTIMESPMRQFVRIHTGETNPEDWVISGADIMRIPASDVQLAVRGKYEKRKVLVPLPWDGGPFDYDNYDEKTHSEWEEHWFCPNCGKDFGESRPTDGFCPKCGADMRE